MSNSKRLVRTTLLRGTLVNRTYGTDKNLYISFFYEQYLVLFTMVPRDID